MPPVEQSLVPVQQHIVSMQQIVMPLQQNIARVQQHVVPMYCRERLFVALDFRKGDFGAPLTHLAMRRIIFLVLGLIEKSTTIRDF